MPVSRVAAWSLIALDVAIVALTNADAFIDEVHAALPWTHADPCDVWSARFYAVTVTLSGAALLFSVRTLAGRAASVVSGLLLLYWLALASLAAISMCVE
ncbi:MAG: hypothetical protein M3134_09835 [Actinomycetota bacterium]|nr:hypothetical protein [Actinomycetota bacterium]